MNKILIAMIVGAGTLMSGCNSTKVASEQKNPSGQKIKEHL